VTWIKIGDHQIRVDQIAAWRSEYMNGWHNHVYLTLVSGERLSGEVSTEEFAAFKKAIAE